ncbi:hypothetical protein ACWGKQ_41120 [Streptomyces sp. NPDC054770]
MNRWGGSSARTALERCAERRPPQESYAYASVQVSARIAVTRPAALSVYAVSPMPASTVSVRPVGVWT